MKKAFRILIFILITFSCKKSNSDCQLSLDKYDNNQIMEIESFHNEYDSLRQIWRKDKIKIGDSLLSDSLGNLFLCGEYAAYATGNLIDFEPRIDDYVIELKYLIDTNSFRVIKYPFYRDTNYFYSYKEMWEGGTLTVFEANKRNIELFDSLTQEGLTTPYNIR